MNTRKVIILRGLPGSGKTTLAKEIIKNDPTQWVRYSMEEISSSIGSDDLVEILRDDFLNNAMLNQLDVILDDPYLSNEDISTIKEEVNNFNEWISLSNLDVLYNVEVKDLFQVPLLTCIERDSKKDNPVGELTIRNMYNKYKDMILPWKYLN